MNRKMQIRRRNALRQWLDIACLFAALAIVAALLASASIYRTAL